ncbi:MAG: hypothetical protein LUD48_05820, partial [Prevotella sp.]|nr:hypothetical protein [Prevotella sp.]
IKVFNEMMDNKLSFESMCEDLEDLGANDSNWEFNNYIDLGKELGCIDADKEKDLKAKWLLKNVELMPYFKANDEECYEELCDFIADYVEYVPKENDKTDDLEME